MKTIFPTLFFFLVFLFNPLFGQEYPNLTGNNKVTSIAYWSEGDIKRFHFTETESTFKNDKDKPSSVETSEYTITIKVLEEQDSSYLMEMVYSDFKFPETRENMDFQRALADMSEGLKIIYTTNELGNFDSIVNKDELMTALKKQLKETMELVGEELENEEQKAVFSDIMNYISELIIKPENLNNLYAEDIYRIHGYYGFEMIVSNPVQVELEYTLYNNFIINGTGTITLNSIDKNRDHFSFSVNEQPNREELKNYLKQIFNYLLLAMNDKKADFSEFKITSKSKSKYTMSLSTGWLEKATITETQQVTFGKKSTKTITKYIIEQN